MILATAVALASASSANAVQLRRSAFVSAGRAGDRTVSAVVVAGDPVQGVSGGGSATLWHGFLGPLGATSTAVATTQPAVMLGHPAPNPCAARVAIRYAGGDAHSVALAVYDLRGRLVRRLPARPASAGEWAYWDLCANDGERVGAGVYLVRLDAAGARLARSVVVLP